MNLRTINMNASSVPLLDTWNHALSETLSPNTILHGASIVIGVCGNIIVFFVYLNNFRSSNGRYFVPYLAIVDLLALCETSSFIISKNLNPVKFYSEAGCKMGWFFGYFLSFVSIFLLLVIAIQRYLKICRPHSRQMTLKWRQLSLGLVFIVAFLFACPTPFTHGLDTARSDVYNVTGSACRRLDREYRRLSLGHSLVINVIIFATAVALIVIYSLIGRVVVTHIRRKMSTCVSQNKEAEKMQRSSEHRSTLMFMFISGIFIVSFTPKAVIFILECINDRFWDTLPIRYLFLVRTLDTLFVVNNVANPIVYAVLDVKFTAILKGMIRKISKSRR